MVNTIEAGSREDHRCRTCCGPSSSRRGFLAGLSALGVASVLPTFAAHGQTKPTLIDTHLRYQTWFGDRTAMSARCRWIRR